MTEQAFRFELAPNKRQVTLLAQAVGTRRFAYNWGLARIEQHYRQTGRFLTAIDLHTELCALKKSDFAWMYEVSKCAPQEALRDLEKAYKRFFKGESRRPRFKKKGRCVDSFRVYDDKKRSFAVEPRAITIPRVGRVRTKEQTSKLLAALTQNGDIVSATLTREPDGKWFVSLLARREREFWEQKQDPSCEGRVVGIDLGISMLLTCHSGASYLETGPGHRLEDELRRLKRLGRELSRRQQGSKGYGRTQARLARSYARVRRRRRDFTHKLTTQLAKTTSVIVIDLAVKNLLANKRLARRISDAGWGEIVRQLEYKAGWYGATVIQADRYYPSSKTCSDCGWVNCSLGLKERVFDCKECGLHIGRDRNAARNLYKLGLTEPTTVSATGSNAGGEDVRPTSSRAKKAASLKPEGSTGPAGQSPSLDSSIETSCGRKAA